MARPWELNTSCAGRLRGMLRGGRFGGGVAEAGHGPHSRSPLVPMDRACTPQNLTGSPKRRILRFFSELQARIYMQSPSPRRFPSLAPRRGPNDRALISAFTELH